MKSKSMNVKNVGLALFIRFVCSLFRIMIGRRVDQKKCWESTLLGSREDPKPGRWERDTIWLRNWNVAVRTSAVTFCHEINPGTCWYSTRLTWPRRSTLTMKYWELDGHTCDRTGSIISRNQRFLKDPSHVFFCRDVTSFLPQQEVHEVVGKIG